MLSVFLLNTSFTKTNSKLLFWIVRDPPNFKGGHQWLSKIQYELYLKYWNEIKEDLIHGDSDPRINDVFQKQRELMNLVKIEDLNKRKPEVSNSDCNA